MPILTDEERVGTLVADKYRIEEVLARGGMGVIFRGRHSWTHRPVAVKFLSSHFASDPEVVERFMREGRAASALKHPHIVDILDMGRSSDGSLFMVLELLEGEDLARVLDREIKLTPERAVDLVVPITSALAYAHELGFVHRDLKPGNIFVTRHSTGTEVVKLLDFGIAKVLTDDVSHTRTGVIVGTPHFMSPEQASGTRVVGPLSDVWAMGVVLYLVLSGRMPFDGPSATAILMSVLTSEPSPLERHAKVPVGLAQVVASCLSKDPEKRPRDMRALGEALRHALTTEEPASELAYAETGSAPNVPHDTVATLITQAPDFALEPANSARQTERDATHAGPAPVELLAASTPHTPDAQPQPPSPSRWVAPVAVAGSVFAALAIAAVVAWPSPAPPRERAAPAHEPTAMASPTTPAASPAPREVVVTAPTSVAPPSSLEPVEPTVEAEAPAPPLHVPAPLIATKIARRRAAPVTTMEPVARPAVRATPPERRSIFRTGTNEWE